MDWFWIAFNFVCGVAGLAGLWLAVRAERRAKSVEGEVRRVVRRNGFLLLAHDIETAIGEGNLFLADRARSRRLVHLGRLRQSIAAIRGNRLLSRREQVLLQRMLDGLRTIQDVTDSAEKATRVILEELAALRRRLFDLAAEEES
jgi:hypothetical protein